MCCFLCVSKYISVTSLIWFAAIRINWGEKKQKTVLVLVSNWLHSFLLADFLSSYVSDGITWQIPFKWKSFTQLLNTLLVHNDIVKHPGRNRQTLCLCKMIVFSSLGDEINWWETNRKCFPCSTRFVIWTQIPSTQLYSV